MQNPGPPVSAGNLSDPPLHPPFSQVLVAKKVRTWPAVLTLFVLAALIPESIATYNSSPLLLLAHPITLLFICAFYGSIALLVRELMRRRQLGWASILLLGMAAGSINEGIVAGTWYKVQYTGYTMISGVNPAVAVGLTVFHTLYSTVLPILLVDLIFPQLATRSWLHRKSGILFLLLLVLTTLEGFAVVANRSLKAVVLLGVLALIVIALTLPRARPRPLLMERVPGLGRLRWLGGLGTVLFFLIFAIIPGILGPRVASGKLPDWQILTIGLMIGYFWLVVAMGSSWSRRVGWGKRQTLAVITGALLPAILLSFVVPAALLTLEPVVTLPMLVLLIWLARRTKRLEEAARVASLPVFDSVHQPI